MNTYFYSNADAHLGLCSHICGHTSSGNWFHLLGPVRLDGWEHKTPIQTSEATHWVMGDMSASRERSVCSSALPTWYVRRWWVASLLGLTAPSIIMLTLPPHFHPSLVPWFHDSVRYRHCLSSTPKKLLLQLPKALLYCSWILSNPMRLPKGKCLFYRIQKLTFIFQLIFVQIISHQILSFLF